MSKLESIFDAVWEDYSDAERKRVDAERFILAMIKLDNPKLHPSKLTTIKYMLQTLASDGAAICEVEGNELKKLILRVLMKMAEIEQSNE